MLPLVPGYLSFVSGVGFDELGARPRRVVTTTAAFVAGFGAIFVALGAGAAWFGGALLQNRRTPERPASERRSRRSSPSRPVAAIPPGERCFSASTRSDSGSRSCSSGLPSRARSGSCEPCDGTGGSCLSVPARCSPRSACCLQAASLCGSRRSSPASPVSVSERRSSLDGREEPRHRRTVVGQLGARVDDDAVGVDHEVASELQGVRTESGRPTPGERRP